MTQTSARQRSNDRRAVLILEGGRPRKGFPPDLVSRARKRLTAVFAATQLDRLNVYPGHRLEKLQGQDRYSLRVNDQWRIIFRWDRQRHQAWDIALSKHEYRAR